MKKTACFYLLTLTMSMFIYFSCTFGINIKNNNDDPGVITDTETILWELYQDENETVWKQFSTNDKKMLKVKGRTFWFADEFSARDSFEIETFKTSGVSGYGYGAIFCIQGDNTGDERNFYAILIRTNASFQIIKIVDKEQYMVELPGNDNGWNEVYENGSNILLSGSGVKNKIRIDYLGNIINGYAVYEIYFNDKFAVEIVENNTGGMIFDGDKGRNKYGFINTLSPVEYFPYVPNTVFYRLVYH